MRHTRKFEHLDTHSEILLRSQWFETHCDLLNITEFFKLLILLIFSVILTVSSNLAVQYVVDLLMLLVFCWRFCSFYLRLNIYPILIGYVFITVWHMLSMMMLFSCLFLLPLFFFVAVSFCVDVVFLWPFVLSLFGLTGLMFRLRMIVLGNCLMCLIHKLLLIVLFVSLFLLCCYRYHYVCCPAHQYCY